MVLVGSDFYVAATDALLRFAYRTGDTKIASPGTKVADLPGGPINHHWTHNVIASRDGSRLYVTIGSNSNTGENGFVGADGKAFGRPVGVAIDKRGALLVADDAGNSIWRVTAANG